MADPVSLLAITGMGMAAAGAVTSAYGAEYQGAAQSAQAKYQAGVADVNAKLAKQDAAYATQVGEVEAQEIGLKGAAQRGQTVVDFAAGNIKVGSGSAGQVVDSERMITEYEEGVTRTNAAKRAYGFTTTAAADTAQGAMYRSAAGTAVTAADISATSSLLGGVGSVSTKWLQASQAGIFSGGGSGGGVNPDSTAGRVAYSSSIYGG